MIAIVKPVGNYCNLRCDYCFYHGTCQGKKRLMSEELLEKFLVELNAVAPKTAIIWHGGEPLLAGREFYQRAFAIQRELWAPGQCTNLAQTNGTLVTDEWADFFKAHDFRIGVSLDGCPDQHNTHRRTVVGVGSHDLAMRGIRTLQRNKVDFGIIQTVTKSTLGYAAESFNYLHQVVGARSFSLNVFQALGSKDPWALIENVTDEEWGRYLEEVFEQWLVADDRDLIVREIETLVQGAVGKMCRACRFNGSCGQYFCLEPDGLIYPCDRLMSPSDLWGDLTQRSLSEILDGGPRKKFLAENAKSYESCRGCEWFNSCHNGCGSHRVGGIGGKFYYCNSMKRSFDLVRGALSENSLGGR